MLDSSPSTESSKLSFQLFVFFKSKDAQTTRFLNTKKATQMFHSLNSQAAQYHMKKRQSKDRLTARSSKAEELI